MKLRGTKPRAAMTNEPETASLHQSRVVKLPNMMKPATVLEEIFASTVPALRGESGQRAVKVKLGRLGDPHGHPARENLILETITVLGAMGKSEEPVVVKKRGNVRGAKGLWLERVDSEARGPD